MLFHTVTHIHSDGLGIWAKDNANAEIISGFTYYCQIGYTATGGSKIRSLNSSNSYGEFGVFSKGFDTQETAIQVLSWYNAFLSGNNLWYIYSW